MFKLITFCALLGGMAGLSQCHAAGPPRSPSTLTRLSYAAWQMTPGQVARLEKHLAAKPTDTEARAKLLAYYTDQFHNSSSEKARVRHALWFIKHRPQSEIAASRYCDFRSEDPAFLTAKELWIRHSLKQPKSVPVLAHAAQFFFDQSHKDWAETLWKKLTTLQPAEPRWRKKLGLVYQEDMEDGDERFAAKALKEYEAAWRLTRSERDRFDLLPDLAEAAFIAGEEEKARAYVEDLLERSQRGPDNGSTGKAVHYGHTLLGKLALKSGQKEEAARQLLASVGHRPRLIDFEYRFDLAADLLKAGDRETVLTYLGSFTQGGNMRPLRLPVGHSPEGWIRQIRSTGTTDFDGWMYVAYSRYSP